jgi:cholesterol transport system auxiliary component
MIQRLLLIACLLPMACSVLPERTPVDLYQLPPSSLTQQGATTVSLDSLRIARPSTSDALGGTRILILADDNSFRAYADSRWSAQVPTLWRDWLLDAFWRDGRVPQLSASADGLQAQFELNGMLRAFHVEENNGRLVAVIRYDANLVETANRQIVSSQRFEARETVTGTSTAAAVRALGMAADQLAVELIQWTVSH